MACGVEQATKVVKSGQYATHTGAYLYYPFDSFPIIKNHRYVLLELDNNAVKYVRNGIIALLHSWEDNKIRRVDLCISVFILLFLSTITKILQLYYRYRRRREKLMRGPNH